VSYGAHQAERPGVLVDDATILPLDPLLAELGLHGADMNPILGLLPQLRQEIEAAIDSTNGDGTIARDTVRLGPPVPHPQKIIVIGGNYLSHVQEASAVTNGIAPTMPILILKPSNNVVGPHDPIVRPRGTTTLDYEAELTVVIGRGGRHIPKERALEHIAGYMNGDDAGDRQSMMGEGHIVPLYFQPTRGKAFDTFCPTGPWITTADEVPDPNDLSLKCWVNDELRQDGSTSDMIFDVPTLIELVSDVMTLCPGDIMLTGTPAGCGGLMKPPKFLQPGDILRQEIAGMGVMENPIVDEA
jgi:2-keto-4-pentenoate hydratase/2-oxohepta-3-ene-1,7-dioic acid hydratase in catechol pathway